MLLQPYHPHELQFAYCYRLFVRWRTHCARPYLPLVGMDQMLLNRLVNQYDIHVLECASNATDLMAAVSLQPAETISACVGKMKGQVSKWLRQALQLTRPTNLLSKGYFACTVGKSTREAVEQYLSRQAEHHGYNQRKLPPVFVEEYEFNDEDEAVSPRSMPLSWRSSIWCWPRLDEEESLALSRVEESLLNASLTNGIACRFGQGFVRT